MLTVCGLQTKGMLINASDLAVEIMADGTLLIRRVAVSEDGSIGEEGTYSCVARNAFGSATATTVVQASGGKEQNANTTHSSS